jgi:hypothetical protein
VALEAVATGYDRHMRRLLLVVALASAVVFAPQAAAKGPVMLCGARACAPLVDEGPAVSGLLAVGSQTPAQRPAPSPYYIVRFKDATQPLGFWVPGARVLQVGASTTSSPGWVQPQPDMATLLLAAADTGLAPYTPHAEVVTVGAHEVARPRGYLRLYTLGTPTTERPDRHAWVQIWITAGTSPWTNTADSSLWVSFAGPYLLRDGQVLRIPQALALRIRHRLPLTG